MRDRRRLRRRSDKPFYRWRTNAARDLWLLILSGFLLWSAIAAQSESRDRRDQTCIFFERQYQADVRDLKATYDYLVRLSAAEQSSSLNVTVLKRLPQSEDQVKNEHPPAYCAQPGIGLDDDTFLPVPKRPLGLPVPQGPPLAPRPGP